MNTDKALAAVREQVKNENMIHHMLATEAVMRALAGRFNENEEEWGLAGLLHDIDIELTSADMTLHGRPGADMARRLGAPEAVWHAILAHNDRLGEPRVSLLDKALFCADPLTGLITATALVRPDRKLMSVEAKSVKKRFREERFAAGANRAQIARCGEIGLELDVFIELGLVAMKGVAQQLGL